MKRQLVLLAVVALAALACSFSVDLFNPPEIATPFPNLPASATPNILAPTSTPVVILPPATLTSVPPTPVNDTPALTAERLKNAHLNLPDQGGVVRDVQFVNGQYQAGADTSDPNYIQLYMTDTMAFGDLDGDGATDAVIVIGESRGGSGTFVSVDVIFNRGGLPVYAAGYAAGDRTVIRSLSISNGEILADSLVHGPNDGLCCPSQSATQVLRLWNNALVLSSFSTLTPSNASRTITIDSPANGVEVDKIFTLTGKVTIAPFENSLVYKIYIPGMADPFTQGPLMVTAAEMGGPGTFELPLNFTAAGYSGPVYITISDLSAADGSTLALDALFVTVK